MTVWVIAATRGTMGDRQSEEDDLFDMANLFPRTTGLPM
jgi:hypothetical protein